MLKGKTDKLFGILLILLLSFNFFYLLHINNSIAVKQSDMEAELLELGNQITTLLEDKGKAEISNTDETINFLKQEYSNYRDFANSDREGFMDLVNLFFVALGVLVTGGIIVLHWIFGQTKAEVKENANTTIKSSINKIEEETKKQFKNLINPTIKDFEEKYNELERFMENQQLLRKSRVLVLTPKSKRMEMEKLELKRIREIVGESQVLILEGIKEVEQELDNQVTDIIVYRYDKPSGSEQEETIRGYMQMLLDRESKVPVVVYAKGNRVDGEDEEMVNLYPYSVMANLPTTLTSNMISLINILSYERR